MSWLMIFQELCQIVQGNETRASENSIIQLLIKRIHKIIHVQCTCIYEVGAVKVGPVI